jgi:hypothetical protein
MKKNNQDIKRRALWPFEALNGIDTIIKNTFVCYVDIQIPQLLKG